MYQTRSELTKKIPIPRKGTKYIAKAFNSPKDSVPLVVAIRDMIKLARTSKEVKEMIKNKSLKINGKEAKDVRDSILLFNILQADKPYILTLTPSGRFAFEETKSTTTRLCKVVNKTMYKGKLTQLNLHDGTNVLTKEKINVHDSVFLDEKNQIKSYKKIEKGNSCMITKGRYLGLKGTIEKIDNKKLTIKIKDNENSPILDIRSVITL